jgi:hypothetical protein
MINAVAKVMTIVKTAMNPSVLGPRRGNIAITIHRVVLTWSCRRERFSRLLVHAAPDRKVATMFVREAVDENEVGTDAGHDGIEDRHLCIQIKAHLRSNTKPSPSAICTAAYIIHTAPRAPPNDFMAAKAPSNPPAKASPAQFVLTIPSSLSTLTAYVLRLSELLEEVEIVGWVVLDFGCWVRGLEAAGKIRYRGGSFGAEHRKSSNEGTRGAECEGLGGSSM